MEAEEQKFVINTAYQLLLLLEFLNSLH